MANFAIVRDGTVENIVVADVIEDISPPDGTTVVAVDIGAEIGGTYDGTKFVPIPPPPPPDWPAIDQATVDRLLLDSGVMRAFALMMFEIGKAGKTGDWAFFDDVIDKATFKTLIKGLIR